MTMTLWGRAAKTSRKQRLQTRLRVEMLESRLVPYNATGNAWPVPQLVTISFVPDGTQVAWSMNGPIYSSLQANFNAKFGSPAAWQNAFLKAAQAWAAQTNINFAVVPDNGAALGSGNYEQGDPGYGDIRISGFDYGSSDPTLASAFYPPPSNNYSIGGDILFNLDVNSGWTMAMGGGTNVQTVAEHEIGHALGLGHSTVGGVVMWQYYTGYKVNLYSDDIAGIRNVYSANNPRAIDSYDAAGSNGTFAAASSINASINTTNLTGLVTGLDVTTTTDLDYYTFTAPSGSNATGVLTVQSSGLSLLAPKVTVYASNQTTILGSANGAGNYGTTLTVNFAVTSGSTYYIKVQGADTTALGTGVYGMTLNFGNNATPVVPLPNTQTANGNPLVSGGGSAETDPDLRADGSDPFVATPTAPSAAPAPVAPHVSMTLPASLLNAPASAPVVNAVVVQPAGVSGLTYVTAPTFVNAGPSVSSMLQDGGGVSAGGNVDAVVFQPALIIAPETAHPAPAVTGDDSDGLSTSTRVTPEFSDACFGSDGAAFGQSHEMAAALASDELAPSADQGAALAGLFVAFGSFWGVQRDMSEEEKRQPRHRCWIA
jgi:hypothetical protein